MQTEELNKIIEKINELEKLVKQLIKKIESIEHILQYLGILPHEPKPCIYKYYILDVSAKSNTVSKIKAICALTKKECKKDPRKCELLK